MEMMIDRKQIRVISLLKFKIHQKDQRTTHNMNNTIGPGTANGRTMQWCFKKFCKGVPWRWEVRCPAIGSWQWQLRAIIKPDHLTTTQEVAKELNVNHPSHSAFEAT